MPGGSKKSLQKQQGIGHKKRESDALLFMCRKKGNYGADKETCGLDSRSERKYCVGKGEALCSLHCTVLLIVVFV